MRSRCCSKPIPMRNALSVTGAPAPAGASGAGAGACACAGAGDGAGAGAGATVAAGGAARDAATGATAAAAAGGGANADAGGASGAGGAAARADRTGASHTTPWATHRRQSVASGSGGVERWHLTQGRPMVRVRLGRSARSLGPGVVRAADNLVRARGF